LLEPLTEFAHPANTNAYDVAVGMGCCTPSGRGCRCCAALSRGAVRGTHQVDHSLRMA
jgi:hypothetical protein